MNAPQAEPEPEPEPRAARWISRECTELLAQAAQKNAADAPLFDVLIVGSGYGAAIAAAELAGARDANGQAMRIAVLERGREFLPGSFPSRMADLPTQLRGSIAGLQRGGEGLFDIRAGGDVAVVLANGLGGGSLINAGVLEIPKAPVFQHSRWQGLSWDRDQSWYAEALRMLGGGARGQENTIRKRGTAPLPKTAVMHQLSQGTADHPGPKSFRPAALSIAMDDTRVTDGQVKLKACRLCGDCALGCNYSAKESLDTNLLVKAFHRGAEIYCGTTVLELRRAPRHDEGWQVRVTPTDEKLRLREGAPAWISTRKLILAAGTLGSTEILLRSREQSKGKLQFSSLLGKRFSGNGDMISFGIDYQQDVHATADEDSAPDRGIGPTITGIIDTTASWTQGSQSVTEPITIEELSVAGALRRACEETLATAKVLHELDTFDWGPHAKGRPAHDPLAVSDARTQRIAVFAAMGDDGANGLVQLPGNAAAQAVDGQVEVVWRDARTLPLFDAQAERIAELARNAGMGGRTIANPLWRFLPPELEFLIDSQRGSPVTVHPLGGCSMGTSVAHGVVDPLGRVFDANPARRTPHHEGLFVLDGAMVPTALSTNPALTIAALALRAVRTLRDADWQWVASSDELPVARARPLFADTQAEIAARATQPPENRLTQAQFTERLAGTLRLRDAHGQLDDFRVEMSLSYQPQRLRELFRANPRTGTLDSAKLEVKLPGEGAAKGPPDGVLRILRHADWVYLQRPELTGLEREEREQTAVRHYALSGSLCILERDRSSAASRIWSAGIAWARNRGLRDLYQAGAEGRADRRAGYPKRGPGFLKRLVSGVKLATHAGEVRRFRYAMKIGPEWLPPGCSASTAPRFQVEQAGLIGEKSITYARPSNPWRQLQELHVTELFGKLAAPGVLKLDLADLAERRRPLFTITRQRDHLEALVDALSVAGLFARLLLSIHNWNARAPDLPRHRPLNRLPGRLPGLEDPQVHEFEVDRLGDQAVKLRLSRYRKNAHAAQTRPVVLIHGYSASGTTFAHPALKPGLAQYLACEAGRDVWVADLRTSCGMPTATHPWTFERVAMADIPALIDYVCQQTGQPDVDVVAHCMGAVMFSMAVLAADRGDLETQVYSAFDAGAPDRFRAERRALPGRIHRAVLSQVGPVVVMSPENRFRAYITSYINTVLGALPYPFRLEPGQGMAGALLDRLFATLPYPDAELRQENPTWPRARTEYVGARHRMDALYGRAFKLANFSEEMLDHLDDFFGPLSLETVAQGIHLAQQQTITTRDGRNRFVTRETLEANWRFPTLSLHGEENGFADIATLARMQRVMAQAGADFTPMPLPGRGHQDSIMGVDLAPTYAAIDAFLGPADVGRPASRKKNDSVKRYRAEVAWLGPMLARDGKERLYVSLGASPQLGIPGAICFLPMRQDPDGGWSVDRDFLGGRRTGIGTEPLDTVWKLRGTEVTDWFTEPLPYWTSSPDVQRLAVLLIYPEPGVRDVRFDWPGPDTSDLLQLSSPVRKEREDSQPGAEKMWGHPERGALVKVRERVVEVWDAIFHWEQSTQCRPPRGATAIGRAPDGVLDLACKALAPSKPLTPGNPQIPVEPLVIALGSCQYPAGLLDSDLAFASWHELNQRLRPQDPKRPDLLVLAGDQIYADATAGVFDPTLGDDRWRKPYERWLRSRPVRRALQQLPAYTLLDDHEIDDNWEPIAPDFPASSRKRHATLRKEGVGAFHNFQRETTRGPLWRHFTARGLPVFLLDTRTQRRHRSSRKLQARMFSERQFRALEKWLLEHPRSPKLIVSPALFLPRHLHAAPATLESRPPEVAPYGALRGDAWDGYPASMQRLLRYVADHRIHGVVMLSGDEHLGLFTDIRVQAPGGDTVLIHSIHSPGLYTPFRFANAKPADFALHERFSFGGTASASPPSRYACAVETQVFEGTGFVYVTLHREGSGGGWHLRCEYSGSGAQVVERSLDVGVPAPQPVLAES